MDRLLALLVPIFILGHALSETLAPEEAPEEAEDVPGPPDFYTFIVSDIHGDKVSLEKFRGKISLVVNVASECGFTDDHYKGLVKLQKIFSTTRKFNVLAFPCNDFGQQEPKENAAIYHFAEERYQINFPLFGKVHILGENVPEPWQYLIEKSNSPPNWNFWKYLVDQDGHVIGAWGPWTAVEEITSRIKEAVDTAMKATGPKRPPRGEEAMEPYMGAHNTGEQYAEGARYEHLRPGEKYPDRQAGGKPTSTVQPPEPIRAMPPESKKPVTTGPGGVTGPSAPAKPKSSRSPSSSAPAPAKIQVESPVPRNPPSQTSQHDREDL